MPLDLNTLRSRSGTESVSDYSPKANSLKSRLRLIGAILTFLCIFLPMKSCTEKGTTKIYYVADFISLNSNKIDVLYVLVFFIPLIFVLLHYGNRLSNNYIDIIETCSYVIASILFYIRFVGNPFGGTALIGSYAIVFMLIIMSFISFINQNKYVCLTLSVSTLSYFLWFFLRIFSDGGFAEEVNKRGLGGFLLIIVYSFLPLIVYPISGFIGYLYKSRSS